LQNHTATSIKSLEGFNRAWYEEAQTLTQASLDLATPTFRTRGRNSGFRGTPTWKATRSTSSFARITDDPDFVCIKVNYYDNPWFPEDSA
jgi:phage terminase large subunit